MKIVACLGALALTAACAETPPAATPAAPAFLPTPYTADQIRESCKPGHTLVFRLEAPGQPAITRTTRFLDGNEQGADFESSAVDEQGRTVEPLHKGKATWEEFRSHARFPSDRTQLTDATIDTPAGTFDSMLYTVRGDRGDVTKFYFARKLAGPPVLMITEMNGAPIRRMTLTAVKDP